MCSVSFASLTIDHQQCVCGAKQSLFSFIDIGVILNMSQSSFILSVTVMEQERSKDDELPAEDS